jgi:hypothetical protein
MNWKGYEWKQLRPDLRYYPSICVQGLSKIMKTLSQNSRSLGQDLNLNLGPLMHEGVLTTWLQCSVLSIEKYMKGTDHNILA